MLKPLLILSLVFGASASFAKCDPGQVSVMRRTSMGLNPSGSLFTQEVTVNIPLVIDGQQACYRQKSNLNVKTESVEAGEHVEFEMTPLLAEFENVPSPSVHQFINIELDADQKASQVQLMSFLCSGEIPIGGDAFSDSLSNLMEKKDTEANVGIFIATGAAADNLSSNQAKKARSKVFDKFLALYESRTDNRDVSREDSGNIYIPSVLGATEIQTISSVERKLYSYFFTRIGSSINGCSKQFQEKMKDFSFEKVSETQPFPGIEFKKKAFSKNYKIKWSLR